MAPSINERPLSLKLIFVLSLALLCVAPPLAAAVRGGHRNLNVPVTYHGGPILNGRLDLALLWYGPFGYVQKHAVRNFIKSLNYKNKKKPKPQVSSWWEVVESYQMVAAPGRKRLAVAPGWERLAFAPRWKRTGPAPGWKRLARKVPPIKVKVVKQLTDKHASFGNVLTKDYIHPLVEKTAAAAGGRKPLVIIFTGRGVSVHMLCIGKCALHGVLGEDQPYIVVGDPETECPGACAWPFHKSDDATRDAVFRPPNENVGADAMVIALASGLAEAVTNPLNSGFFGGIKYRPIEVAGRCVDIYGRGGTPGSPGKVQIDRETGGAFNAYGRNSKKYLLPALWNPLRESCWTIDQ